VIRWLPVLALLLLPACSGSREEEDAGNGFPAGLEAKEAPMLAALVAQGKLPPLSERLPENPLVAKHDFKGYEGPGVYGGTWHRFHTSPGLAVWKMVAGYTSLMRWRFDCLGLEPGLAETWEFNDDGSVLTIHLRKGVRWSDGHPFTSADFAFYHALTLDKRNSYPPPVWSLVDGKTMDVETPEPFTLVLKFAGPNWLVPLWMATGFWEPENYTIPKHYMLQFHPDHSDYPDFNEFERKNLTHQNPERPSLWPWRLVKLEKGGYRVTLERNPYYYVVDDLGRQLPYIDRVKSHLVPDPQVRVLKILAGEVDCQYRGAELRDLALFLKGQKRGRYRVFRGWTSASGANPSILLNWSDPDPVLRKLIRDKRFRRALAYGIDRDTCNQLAWRGLLEPQNATISREAWHFADEAGSELFAEWERVFSEFDLDKGNALLDEMGLTERDAEGFRLRPDGKRLTILMDFPSSRDNIQENDIGLIVAEGWRKLGIDGVIHTPPGAELGQRRRLGKYTVSIHGLSEMDLFTYPDWVFPTRALRWHPIVGRWYETGGEKGEPPTGPMKELLDIYDRMKQEKDLARRHQYVHEAVRIHIGEGPFHLGTCARLPHLVIVSNRFHNVSREGILGPWAIVQPATTYPEQCFIQEDAE
jgi:peptide/nickel transport system substrate-binding protein